MNAICHTPSPHQCANVPTGNAMSRRRLLKMSSAVLLVGGIAVAALNPAHAQTAVPFKALVSASASQTSPTTFQLNGSATASHLGRSGYSGEVTIITVDQNTGIIADTLIETLIAANGDTLTLLCQQLATPVAPGVYQATDQWNVIGGTGRFAGATGSGVGDTSIDLNTGSVTKHLTGTITKKK